jgi:hypothetical protein
MLCSSYGAKTMKNKRERYIYLLPQTRSQEVEYSLFIMVTKVESLEGMEITPVAPRRSFPLQSLISQAFRVSMFRRRSFSRPAGGPFL